MRRSLAIVLALLFSVWLIAPALIASVQSNVPVCCRKDGKHHCVMQAVESDSKSAVAAIGSKCPLFSHASVTAHHELDTARQAAAIFAGSVSHPGGSPQTEAGYRISFHRSRQKRGPPALFFLS